MGAREPPTGDREDFPAQTHATWEPRRIPGLLLDPPQIPTGQMPAKGRPSARGKPLQSPRILIRSPPTHGGHQSNRLREAPAFGYARPWVPAARHAPGALLFVPLSYPLTPSLWSG
jgi:hypothetical protein